MTRLWKMATMVAAAGALLIAAWHADAAAQERQRRPPPEPGPMLAEGTIDLDTPDFVLSLVKSTQTVAALKPKNADGFDFTPGDLLVARSQDGYFHLGDINLRLRTSSAREWKSFSTAQSRTPVTPLRASEKILAAADLAPTLPGKIPLRVTRTWGVEGGKLALRFELKNTSTEAVEIGALGIPLVFNNILTNRTLEQAHAVCSFSDPYIGGDAGYVQVTRLSGAGPALIVVPDGKTPLEAYNPILPRRGPRAPDASGQASPVPIFTDPMPTGITFEGFYEWMPHSLAYAENEWKRAQPWNPPTSATLAPGETRTYGLKFLLAPEIRKIEDTLAANARPVAVGIPGYVLPIGAEARLFLRYSKKVKSIEVEPKDALRITKNKTTRNGWLAYTLEGATWGRARMVVRYADGATQAIHYFVTKPQADAVADLGRFLTTRQWFDRPDDLFRRSPSVMSYDREENKIVEQESRAWIAGLGDEGGSGAWLAGAMKLFGQPEREQVVKYQQFVDKVVWGGLQYGDGERQYGVRKSLFYYQPEELPAGFYRSDFNWTSWTSWNRQHAERVDRSFNYPHVAALHWVMYRLARNYEGLVSNRAWEWYLTTAAQTGMAMTKFAPAHTRFGQMEGDIYLEILRDLKREGMDALAAEFEARMKTRAARWSAQAYPFGSEMPWDSTGQEEVYAWTNYFGDAAKAGVTLNAILGYMPTVPHWGYNGSARRYWDFQYAGKLRRIERQLHHYGSGINAIPVLAAFRESPDDFYLLRVGYGGTLGALTNIDQEGFASAAFHAFPDMLKFDAYTGDYGPNFFGYALNAATYVVNHAEFGWLAFGGNVRVEDGWVKITPLDGFRMRVYLAPAGLWLTLDAGKFASVEYDTKNGNVRVVLEPGTPHARVARLRVEQPAERKGIGDYTPAVAMKMERGAWLAPFGAGVTLVASKPGAAPRR